MILYLFFILLVAIGNRNAKNKKITEKIFSENKLTWAEGSCEVLV